MPVTIRVTEGEDGKQKQIIETVPKKDLICSENSRFQGRIYDPNTGEQIVGEENTGQVNYAIKALEELICITEGKLHQVVMGFAQNLIQCESALQVNKIKRKRKSGEAFGDDYDYIYGIVTTATEWYFILFASDGISCTSKSPLNIRFTESALEEGSEEEKELCKNVKRVMEVIVGLLKDRVHVEKEPAMKKQRVKGYFEKE